MKELFDRDDVREVLRETFYAPPEAAPKKARASKPPKPEHYDVICISLYREDLEKLDAHVSALKARGLRKMSRSALIRYALSLVDPAGIPRGAW